MTSALSTVENVKFPAPDKSKWPKGRYITDRGRGKGAPPQNETYQDPALTTTSTTTTTTTVPATSSTTTTTVSPTTTAEP